MYFIAQCYEILNDKKSQMSTLEETIELLHPILALDKKTDWHRIFAEAAFEHFKIDTFSGRVFYSMPFKVGSGCTNINLRWMITEKNWRCAKECINDVIRVNKKGNIACAW